MYTLRPLTVKRRMDAQAFRRCSWWPHDICSNITSQNNTVFAGYHSVTWKLRMPVRPLAPTETKTKFFSSSDFSPFYLDLFTPCGLFFLNRFFLDFHLALVLKKDEEDSNVTRKKKRGWFDEFSYSQKKPFFLITKITCSINILIFCSNWIL